MLAVADQGVDVSFRVPEVRALLVGTSESFGVYAFGGSPPAFDLSPGTYWSMRWLSRRRGRGGMTTGRAIIWRARLQQTGEPDAFGRTL